MQLSFVVQKKKRKSKLKIGALISASIIFLAVIINVLLGWWLGSNYVNSLTRFIKPPFYVEPMLSGVISLVVVVVCAIGVHFSVLYESNKKQVIFLASASFVLNLLILFSMFLINSLALTLLLIVSDAVVCCFYFKKLKARSFGQLLFIPYIIWLLFNTVIVYAMFLLN